MKKTDRTGEKHITNQGYEVEIIQYNTPTDCIIMFNDKYNTIIKREYAYIKKGMIKNPNHVTIYGIGFMGQGIYNSIKDSKAFIKWVNILRRCSSYNTQISYAGVKVNEKWYNFQNFAQWFYQNYNYDYMEKWHIDKDIICKDCRVYSPETCAFVPREINNLFTKREKCRGDLPIGVQKDKFGYRTFVSGVKLKKSLYKTPEEAFSRYKLEKEVAEKWRDKIDLRIYQAMMDYEVKITD